MIRLRLARFACFVAEVAAATVANACVEAALWAGRRRALLDLRIRVLAWHAALRERGHGDGGGAA